MPNLAGTSSCDKLEAKLKSDIWKVLITSVFKLEKITRALKYWDNIIVMGDKARWMQEGQLGIKMRTVLPNAIFFGLTGTPINRLDHIPC